jgi:hypothetical protein
MAKTRAALTLTDLRATKTAPAPAPVVSGNGERVRRGQTLRLEPEAWRQLKLLGIDQNKPVHDLLIEAVNLLFDHYNRPTIAG